MTQPKSRRRPPFVQALAWFIPGLLAVAAAGLATHPLTLIPLLLANALSMAAICHAIGFDPEPRFGRTVLRRGAAHLVMFTGYTALVFVLVAWPMLQLSQSSSLGAALELASALVLALAALWRLWPAFGLVFVWDDAYPTQRDGSWIFTATLRSIAFGRHLSHEERFFSHFLPAAVALLALAFGAIALTGLYGALPSELRIVALALYGIVLLPLGCLVIANRTLRALLCGRHDKRTKSATAPVGVTAAVTSLITAPLNEQERTAGTPEQAEALLAATRDGDIERALALVDAGADPDTAPAPEDRDQRPVLMLAALLPDTHLLRALIAKGADVNRASGGLTPLLAVTRDSWHGRAEAVLTLLTNGASPLVSDAEGNTPLHGAVLSAEPGVAAMLLDAAAPINALNKAGISPLAVACHAANWPLAKFLLDHGAKPAPADGEPALVAAAGIADDDVTGIKLLLKHRAAVNAVDARHRHALLSAAAEGHEQIARALCAAGADVSLSDLHGSTALMEAARAGACGIVQLLAEAQPDARVRDKHGRDALTLACQSPQAHGETVRALLALGAEPKAPGRDGRSALDHAAAAGRWDLVALLDPETPLPASHSRDVLAEGADTPAHLLDALRFGHWAVVSSFAERVREWPQAQLAQLYLDLTTPGLGAARRWLLEHGLDAETRLQPQLPADPEAAEAPAPALPPQLLPQLLPQFPPMGRRLFDALLQQLPASTEALDDLLQAGASPAGAGLLAQALSRLNGAAQSAALPLNLLERGADPFGPDARERTPLHLAVVNAQLELLQALLTRGCDPNTRDRDGRTPLFAALEHGAQALPLVRALIAHGANPEAADANGETPLGLALEHPAVERWLDWHDWPRPHRPLRADDLPAAAAAGALATVQRLLELGFAVDTRDDQGASALLRACGAGHREIAVCLLDAGADPALAARSGVTPLVAAVAARREALVGLLLERRVAIDQRLPNDATALMVAAAMGYPEIVEALLEGGADVNAVDASGRSALHATAQFGFEHNDSLRARRLFDGLLRHGADINRADSEGKTPLLLLLGAQLRPGSACDATHIGALLPLLLDAGARVEHADQRGVTALHACAMHALLPPARVLLSRGAERQAADAFGRSAADVARQLGYVDIAHELAARAGTIPSVRQTLRQPAQPSE